MKGYNKIRKKTLEILNSQLPEELYYHDINHTLDVLKNCNKYIKRDKIDSHDAKLLRIAALLHDIGFIESNEDHEITGGRIAEKLMKAYGFLKKDIDIVVGLILVTRIPQIPKNQLEKVICDCDLDYLGRSDFYSISDLLFRELKLMSVINSKREWNKFQIKFLEAHNYHTQFALKNRQPHKEARIAELKELVGKLEQ
jgi:predicted metal-dependent HD superfamily phosphohydrolase